MINPKTISFTHTAAFTDGSAFTAADFAGYELSLNDQPAVSLPIAWASAGLATFDLKSLALPTGAYSARVRTVAKNGAMSDYSNAALFAVDVRVPKAVSDLAAA